MALRILMFSGMRLEELCCLCVDDLNLRERELLIRQGKGKKDRLAFIDRSTQQWLAQYLVSARPQLAKSSCKRLLLMDNGKPISHYWVRKSITAYGERLKLFQVFAFDHGTKRIREVSISLVRAFHGRLLDKGLKPASIDCYMTTLRAYLKWCYEHQRILSDLSSRIELPKPAKALPPQPLTQEDIEKLFRSVPAVGIQNLRNRAILEILYACGLRKQELINLNIGDVDFAKGIVHVKGKGDKERLVPIHERALKAISAYLVARGGKPNRKSPLLLTHSLNCKEPHRMTEMGLEMVFRKLNQHFPKHLHPHLLRHTFSLHLLQNGVDLRYVQLLLGHENPDTTSRYLGYCKKEIKAQYDQGIDWILAAE